MSGAGAQGEVETVQSAFEPSVGDFIIADAKDADMAAGMAAPGKSPEHHAQEGKFRSLAEYRELIRQNIRQGLLDIMLMSASTNEVIAIKERMFENSAMTPAARANDTTDIWLAQGGQYPSQESRPFRSATIDHIMCGKVECAPSERSLGIGARVTRRCLERGLITRALPDADTIAFSPPFVVSEQEIDEMVSTARAATDDVAAELRAG